MMRKENVAEVAFGLLLVLVSAISFSAHAAPLPDPFTMTFEAYPSLDHACFDIDVRNNQDSSDDVPFRAILNDTNINVSKTGIRFYEQKTDDLEGLVDDYCDEWVIDEGFNATNGTFYNSTGYVSYLCGNHIVYYQESRWEPRALISRNEDAEKGEISGQFEEITIKKASSKKFRLCYDFGEIKRQSHGYMYFEAKGSLYYDFDNSSYWNESYGFRYRINGNATSAAHVLNVNDTYLPNVWTQNSTEGIYLYCTVSGCGTGLIAIANKTDEKCWENASTLTGNCPESVYPSDILGAWHMDQGSGTFANDSTSAGLDGTFGGNPTWSTGVFGNAINFSDNDAVVGADTGFPTGDASRSVSAWINPDACNAEDYIFAYGAYAAPINRYFGFSLWTNCALCVVGYGHEDCSTIKLSTNQWTFVAVTYDSAASEFIYYINDTDETVATLDFGTVSDSIFGIGGEPTNYGAAYDYDGEIDDVRFYNRVLTQAEMLDLYNNGRNSLAPLGTEETPSADEFYNVTLESPANGTILSDDTPDFSFNFTATYATASCELLIAGTGYGVNATTRNDTTTTLTANASLPDGTHWWVVNCTNSTDVQQSDQNWSIEINDIWFATAPYHNKSFRVSEFINVSGNNFTLGGEVYKILGTDSYYLTDYAMNHTYDDDGNEINNSRAAVIEILNEAKYLNFNVLRTWAGMSGGNGTAGYSSWPQQKTGGHWNLFEVNEPGNYSEEMFAALDWVISEASKRDIRLQLVLINNWDDYGGMRWQVQKSTTSDKTYENETDDTYANWSIFHDQFFNDTDCMNNFRSYINYTLNRNNTVTGIVYKDDPAIFGWLLANEPRAKSQGKSRVLIVNWTMNMTAYIKSIDSNHIVGLGIEGWGYSEDWGEGTDFISNHNDTGVDFATFALHPDQWAYFGARSEHSGDLDWVDEATGSNKYVDWWTNDTGLSYNNRYEGSYVPAYTPAYARHGYVDWVRQKVRWAEINLSMPVLLQEAGYMTAHNKTIKDRFYQQMIHNFYSEGGDGLMFWTLNHDDYYYSTDTNGTMDDGYGFYVSSDALLKNKSASVIDAVSFAMTDNAGGSWVTLLNDYKYDFVVNLGIASDTGIADCTLWLNVYNGTWTGNYSDQINSSDITAGTDYTFTTQFTSGNAVAGDQEFYWLLECCDSSSSCSNSTYTHVTLNTSSPVVTLGSPANNTNFTSSSLDFVYSVANTLDIVNCDLYIDSVFNETSTTVTKDINQTISQTFSFGTYTWHIQCTDVDDNTDTSEERTFTYHDIINPAVAYNSGTTATTSCGAVSHIFINISATDANLDNVSFSFSGTNHTGSDWNGSDGTNYWVNHTGLPDAVYTFYAWANDSAANYNLTASRTITIDTTPPQVFISDPDNITYTTTAGSLNVDFDMGTTNLNYTSYSFNGAANISLGTGTWNEDDSITEGLSAYTTATTSIEIIPNMITSGNLYAIVGGFYGGWWGFKYNGSTWTEDSSLISGLNIHSSTYYSVCGHAYNLSGNGKYELVTIQYNGTSGDDILHGYYWNGTGWTLNDTIKGGLPTNLVLGGPDIKFNISGSGDWELIIGQNYIGPQGYYWTDSWTARDALEDDMKAVADIYDDFPCGDYNSEIILAYGVRGYPNQYTAIMGWDECHNSHNENATGFYWDGTDWIQDTAIIHGLDKAVDYTGKSNFLADTFTYGGSLYMIMPNSSGWTATFEGARWYTENTTFTAVQGINSVAVSANDSCGNLNSSTVYLYVDTLPPTMTNVHHNPSTCTGPNGIVRITWEQQDNLDDLTVYCNFTNPAGAVTQVTNIVQTANSTSGCALILSSLGQWQTLVHIEDYAGTVVNSTGSIEARTDCVAPPPSPGGPGSTVITPPTEIVITLLPNCTGGFRYDIITGRCTPEALTLENLTLGQQVELSLLTPIFIQVGFDFNATDPDTGQVFQLTHTAYLFSWMHILLTVFIISYMLIRWRKVGLKGFSKWDWALVILYIMFMGLSIAVAFPPDVLRAFGGDITFLPPTKPSPTIAPESGANIEPGDDFQPTPFSVSLYETFLASPFQMAGLILIIVALIFVAYSSREGGKLRRLIRSGMQ